MFFVIVAMSRGERPLREQLPGLRTSPLVVVVVVVVLVVVVLLLTTPSPQVHRVESLLHGGVARGGRLLPLLPRAPDQNWLRKDGRRLGEAFEAGAQIGRPQPRRRGPAGQPSRSSGARRASCTSA